MQLNVTEDFATVSLFYDKFYKNVVTVRLF